MSKRFTPQDRYRVRAHILAMADGDARVVAAAEIGSFARDSADEWSDLDLTFSVADGASVDDVLTDWSDSLARDCGAAHLFDLPLPPTIYRVLLLPGLLELDLSFTPRAEFGPLGPHFRLLFGTAVERPHRPPPDAGEVFGLAVHHALRARACIARAQPMQAEYWISALRDEALSLACLARGLPARYGKGFDDLPVDVLERARDAFPAALEREGLLRALTAAIELLVSESGRDDIAPRLRALASEPSG